MQTPILRALALVTVGNAALRGQNVAAFWPGDPMFQYTASLDFMMPREDGRLKRVAAGPLSWFDKLKKRGCRGLRLHNAPMKEHKKLGHIEDRMLVGLVGGGPRWLIEPVYREHSELWEGFDRIGDKNAPDKKIWLTAYVLLGEAETPARVDADVAAASIALRAALFAIENVARKIEGAPFADAFAGARAALDGAPLGFELQFLNHAQLGADAVRLLNATGRGWVFGAMGSWNDIKVADALKPEYDAASEALFAALNRAVVAVANSSYRA